MTGSIIWLILLSSGIICEAQYHNCFMSGGYSGRSTWCGENSKDEENLKDPVEIMKRAKEFLEKQSKIMLDPMTWTIGPPTPLPSISITPATTKANPVLNVEPDVTGVKLQPSYIPLYSVALPNNANSFFTPTSDVPTNGNNLRLLPFVGIISPENSHNLQNIPISTSQANLPFRFENSKQISVQQQQFQNQANHLLNKENEMPLLLKIPPATSPVKFSAEEQNLKVKENNDLTDIGNIKPVRLVLNRPLAALSSRKGNQSVNA
ncbi:hypothetical protein WUBG_12118 [Wuchereria bancrofti]|uniref:Uncharacterized protein n=1 Tax=Wuchereria bancrofti TaxID=6293 RepID=J9ENU2_WUCBA|nr:hypothetical protein WUBG_12118 [Wuchereria bancrofti]